ncbi:GNAT family N-acetyltransferase [Paenibacillus barcinonensis]|uniref:Acetyltransferase (GNAT) family protein n=1 Tax=Paenibacillus barcinonensis TaxID=198119 RepID=A0A2V4VAE7_PAEBA|nr:GNAT family N-acetyltransferase [Paenibacillus barcinonensis]PYE49167.1 acetyltransferase (GNAT) family protein [Paenibacillus barcinonensis]QKS55403.1 GNAT family N-acetyltransferase [Paenibacillus barcinonensis]
MRYIVRSAVAADISELCSVRNNQELFRSYLKQQENSKVILTIAESDDVDRVILGFGVLKLQGKQIPKLSDLYVKEKYRSHGAGSALIRYREELAIQLGFREIFVSVDPVENPKMIKLISAHGYHAISKPYTKQAVYYNDDDTSYEKTYIRIDLKKQLRV